VPAWTPHIVKSCSGFPQFMNEIKIEQLGSEGGLTNQPPLESSVGTSEV
jgi:hypothetical protein